MMNISYDDISIQERQVALQRLRRLFYQQRRRGLLTRDQIRSQSATEFWRYFGFNDLDDYLSGELRYTDDEIKKLTEEKPKERNPT